jgi:hypothetical protein
MAHRLGTLWVGSAGLFVASSLVGCYAHHTADEELVDIPFPAEVYADAGIVVVDAAPPVVDAGKPACSGTNAFETFLCGLQTPSTGTTGTGSSTPDIGSLITLLGGGNTGSTGGIDLTSLINLLGGGTTGTGTQNPFGGGTTGTGTQNPFGGGTTGGGRTTTPPQTRDAGAFGGFTLPTAEECKNPASQMIEAICSFSSGQNGARGATPPAAANGI